VVALTDGPQGRNDFLPVYSPDGTKIAWTRAAYAESRLDIWTMNANGTNFRNITRTRGVEDVAPDWGTHP
jgi:Tol biopolymer transport system component